MRVRIGKNPVCKLALNYLTDQVATEVKWAAGINVNYKKKKHIIQRAEEHFVLSDERGFACISMHPLHMRQIVA